MVMLAATGAGAQAGRPGEGYAPAEIRTLGVGAQAIYAVQRGERISLFVDQVPVDVVLSHLQELGGPTFSNRKGIARTVTTVLHDVTMEEALKRLLRYINSSFHYRDGRVAHVTLLGEVPGRATTTPKPVESRSEWSRIETGQ